MGSSKGKMFHPQPGASIMVEPAGNRVAPDKSLRPGGGVYKISVVKCDATGKKGWINPGFPKGLFFHVVQEIDRIDHRFCRSNDDVIT